MYVPTIALSASLTSKSSAEKDKGRPLQYELGRDSYFSIFCASARLMTDDACPKRKVFPGQMMPSRLAGSQPSAAIGTRQGQ
jgi:hypothetical protein